MKATLSLRELFMIGALAVIWIFFAFQDPKFVGSQNLSNLLIELSMTAVLALGMLLIILPGHIDLSAGSGVGLVGGIASVLVFHGDLPAPLAMLVGVIAGIILWTAMGSLIVKARMPAFIVTLGGLLVFKGLFWLVISNATVPVTRTGDPNLYSLLTTWFLPEWAGWTLAVIVFSILLGSQWISRRQQQQDRLPVEDFESFFLKNFITLQVLLLFVLVCNQHKGIPLAAIILGGVAAFVYILTQHTPFGRYLYAIGGNEEAATLSGVPVQTVVISAFGIMGVIVALAGFLQTAYAGASTTTVGELMELDAIAACVIGGASLKGGRGSVMGVLLGALIMASLINGMTLMAVEPEYKYIARGGILTLAVWLDHQLNHSQS